MFTDSDFIPDQIHAQDPKLSAAMKPLHKQAMRLIDRIGRKRVRVLWVPRDMNTEADQRAADAFFVRKGDVWFRPTPT